MVNFSSPMVKLIGITNNGKNILKSAISVCRGTKVTDDNYTRLIKAIVNNDEGSVIEHISTTWELQKVSAIALSQLSRHRISSLTVASRKYTVSNTSSAPVSAKTTTSDEIIAKAIEQSYETYKSLIELGEKKQVARSVLPSTDCRDMIFTINLRSLRNLIGQRIPAHAHSDIRQIAFRFLDEMSKIEWIKPIFEDLHNSTGKPLVLTLKTLSTAPRDGSSFIAKITKGNTIICRWNHTFGSFTTSQSSSCIPARIKPAKIKGWYGLPTKG